MFEGEVERSDGLIGCEALDVWNGQFEVLMTTMTVVVVMVKRASVLNLDSTQADEFTNCNSTVYTHSIPGGWVYRTRKPRLKHTSF